jgi:soluble lytic murein transglycosylase-like protein
MKITETQLRAQLKRAQKGPLFDLLQTGAQSARLPLSYVLAIASRETNIANIAGDPVNGVPQGRGVMQIDIRSHPIARSTDFLAHPEILINYGCGLLRSNIDWAAKHWPQYSATQHLKLAAAAYNSGRGNVSKSMATGDCDRRTTGGDYGKDVLARMTLIETILQEGSQAPVIHPVTHV